MNRNQSLLPGAPCPKGGGHEWEWYGSLINICQKCFGLTYFKVPRELGVPEMGNGFVWLPDDPVAAKAEWDAMKRHLHPSGRTA
jgi:hypothetical protein